MPAYSRLGDDDLQAFAGDDQRARSTEALLHGFERVMSGKITMIRSQDLSWDDGRYSLIAEFWAGEVALGFTPTSGVRTTSSGRSRAGIGPESCRCLRERLA